MATITIDEVEYPAIWQICDDCRGEGHNASHLGAFTQSDREEMGDEWYDFQEAYMEGRYDQRCEPCNGTGKVLVPDEDRLTPTQHEAINLHYQEEAEYRAICEMERRLGC